jgi:hypothetical protein
MKISTTIMENSMEVLKKLKIELPWDSAIPLLGIYLKECKSGSNKGIAHCCSVPVSICAH